MVTRATRAINYSLREVGWPTVPEEQVDIFIRLFRRDILVLIQLPSLYLFHKKSVTAATRWVRSTKNKRRSVQ